VAGNFAYNYNRVKEYDGEVDIYGDDFQYRAHVDYAHKTIAGFPEYLGNLSFQFDKDDLQANLDFRLVGPQYVELANIDSLSIDGHLVASWSMAYRMRNLMGLGDLTAKVSIENLFDKRYETAGYVWSYGLDPGAMGGPVEMVYEAKYFPAAERWFWGQLTWELF
jgi:outer membrane receptor protein involved in Fe transport